MREEELTRLEKLHQVKKNLRWVVFIIFFVLIVIYLIAGGTLAPFYLPIPDGITILLAGIFTATWFFGAFTIGEIAFETSDTKRVLCARKSMKKALAYGIILCVTGVIMLQPVVVKTTEYLTRTEINTGYGADFNISFTPLDPHGFTRANTMNITVSNGHAAIIIAELGDFETNYASGRYYALVNETLNNTTTGDKSCAQFLTPERMHKEFVIHIVKKESPEANVRILITKEVCADYVSWSFLLISSGILLIIWIPVIYGLKKKFEKGSIVR